MATDSEIAFPKLSESEIEALKKFGGERQVTEGEMLFKEGDRDFCFVVILDGEVEIFDTLSGKPHRELRSRTHRKTLICQMKHR